VSEKDKVFAKMGQRSLSAHSEPIIILYATLAIPAAWLLELRAGVMDGLRAHRYEMLVAGLDDFVRKPYLPNEIIDCMARHLGVWYTGSLRRGRMKRSAVFRCLVWACNNEAT
jgi:hypothetical protein